MLNYMYSVLCISEKKILITLFSFQVYKKLLVEGSRCTAVALKTMSPAERYVKHVDWLQNEENLTNAMTRIVKRSPGKLNVLCHGDYHVNNLLFRKATAEKRMQLKIFDLQLFRFAPPYLDLHFFLNASVNMTFLMQHEAEVNIIRTLT
jgi:Ser/Thr protein kinase RdoA (MazF antagonist)